jgi:2-polyprenyl-6-methoxyphenol hydroxylase-like FAD-dependent oxidoreductase
VAAAFDLAAVRQAGGPGALAAKVLGEVGLTVPLLLADASWHGTGPLTTRRARVAGERLFVLGDAAGYVEPFTGEGMAWALRSAVAVAPLALAAIHDWQPNLGRRWVSLQRTIVGRRQRVCRVLTSLLRYPTLAAAGAKALGRFPWLAAPLLRSLNSADGDFPVAPASALDHKS